LVCLQTEAEALLPGRPKKCKAFSLRGFAKPTGLAGIEPAPRMINRTGFMHQKNGNILSYKRTIYKSTFEVGESVEIYDDHFFPDAKTTRLPARRH
jgi:hypothetical protein